MTDNVYNINQSFIDSLLNENSEPAKNLLDCLPVGVIVLDINGNNIHYVSRRFTDITGYKNQDIKDIKELIKLASTDFQNYQDILNAWNAQLEDLNNTLISNNEEYLLICKKGNAKNLIVRLSILDKHAIIAAFEDITLHKRTQEAYNETQEKYILQNATLIANKKEIELNAYRLETLLKLNDMTKKTIPQITDFFLDAALQLTKSDIGYLFLMNEDETELTLAAWSKSAMKNCTMVDKPVVYKVEETGLWSEAVRQRRPIITNDYNAPDPLKRGYPKGHVPVKSHMNIPVFDNDKIVAVAGVGNKEEDYEDSDIINLTVLMQGVWSLLQKKKAEEKIIRQNKDLQIQEKELLLQNLELKKRDNHIVAQNQEIKDQEEELRLQNAELREKEEELLAQNEELQAKEEELLAQNEELKAKEIELITQNKEFQAKEEKIVTQNKLLKQKEEVLITKNIQLKTQEEELKSQNELLQEKEKLLIAKNLELEKIKTELLEAHENKNRFFSSMSHELRTPLNAILGFSQALEKAYFGPLNDKQIEYVNLIHNSGKHLLSLINDILDIAKIDAGKMELKVEEIDMEPAIDNVLAIMSVQLQNKNLVAGYRIEDDITTVKLDKQKFKQILLNLLSNAVKFTPEEGYIQIIAEKIESNYIKISVIDSGVGIKEEDQEKLFSEFYQSNQSRDQALGGTGIGLALCKRLVEMHNGTIGVCSKINEGSTFWFTIPEEY